MTTNTSRKLEIWVEKNPSRVEKKWESRWKKDLESRKRQHWPGVLSINVFTSKIQSSGPLATKKCSFFSSPLLDLSRTRKGSLVSIIWQFTIPILAPWRGQKNTCSPAVKILWDSHIRLCRNREHAWAQTVRTCILKRSAPFLNVPGTVRNEGRILHDIIINLV